VSDSVFVCRLSLALSNMLEVDNIVDHFVPFLSPHLVSVHFGCTALTQAIKHHQYVNQMMSLPLFAC